MSLQTAKKRLRAWEGGFGRSRHGNDIWCTGRLDPPPGVPFDVSLSRLWQAYTVAATWEFADGYLVVTTRRNGNWVRGWAAMRYLCLIHGFEWPAKKLRGEPFVPDRELLMFAVAEWARTGPVYGYRNPYQKPVAVRPDHRDRFWRLLADIHVAEGIDIGETAGDRCTTSPTITVPTASALTCGMETARRRPG